MVQVSTWIFVFFQYSNCKMTIVYLNKQQIAVVIIVWLTWETILLFSKASGLIWQKPSLDLWSIHSEKQCVEKTSTLKKITWEIILNSGLSILNISAYLAYNNSLKIIWWLCLYQAAITMTNCILGGNRGNKRISASHFVMNNF